MADTSSSFSSPSTSIHPFLRRYQHILAQPCEGRKILVPIIHGPPKMSDIFAGRYLVHFSPTKPPGFRYRFRGPIRARNLQRRFIQLMQSYNSQLLEFARTIHQPGCLASRCTICEKIESINQFEITYTRPERFCLKLSNRLAEEMEWLLTECILALRESFPDQSYRALPCPEVWSLDQEAWTQSIKGLLELGDILLEPQFKKYGTRIWDVIDAHLTFTCPDLKFDQDLTKRWFEEERWKERRKAKEDLEKGDYDDLFIYALDKDSQKLPEVAHV